MNTVVLLTDQHWLSFCIFFHKKKNISCDQIWVQAAFQATNGLKPRTNAFYLKDIYIYATL